MILNFDTHHEMTAVSWVWISCLVIQTWLEGYAAGMLKVSYKL